MLTLLHTYDVDSCYVRLTLTVKLQGKALLPVLSLALYVTRCVPTVSGVLGAGPVRVSRICSPELSVMSGSIQLASPKSLSFSVYAIRLVGQL